MPIQGGGRGKRGSVGEECASYKVISERCGFGGVGCIENAGGLGFRNFLTWRVGKIFFDNNFHV